MLVGLVSIGNWKARLALHRKPCKKKKLKITGLYESRTAYNAKTLRIHPYKVNLNLKQYDEQIKIENSL